MAMIREVYTPIPGREYPTTVNQVQMHARPCARAIRNRTLRISHRRTLRRQTLSESVWRRRKSRLYLQPFHTLQAGMRFSSLTCLDISQWVQMLWRGGIAALTVGMLELWFCIPGPLLRIMIFLFSVWSSLGRSRFVAFWHPAKFMMRVTPPTRCERVTQSSVR